VTILEKFIRSMRVSAFSHVPPRSRLLGGVFPGWFLIRIISALSQSELLQIGHRLDLSFSSRRMISPTWFLMYLNTTQLEGLKSEDKFEFFAAEKQIEINASKEAHLVRAIPNWRPSLPYVRIGGNLFLVKGDVSQLASDEFVLSISPFAGRRLLNRYVSGFLESGDEGGFISGGSIMTERIFERFMNLTGEGEVVIITDSGVDSLHPFFYDPDHPSDFSPAHRKIYGVTNAADLLDKMGGHGTHVAGTIAGECQDADSGISFYKGVAPKSKLHVVDIGFTEADTGSTMGGEFDADELFGSLAQSGISVSSNSWGYGNLLTEAITVEYDGIAHRNRHLLFVFAAGNDGDFFTISSPSDSKNALSIGSVNPPHLQKLENSRTWFAELEGECVALSVKSFCKDPWALSLGTPMKRFANSSSNIYVMNHSGDVCSELSWAESANFAAFVYDSAVFSSVSCPTHSEISCFSRSGIAGHHISSIFPNRTDLPASRARLYFSSRGPMLYSVNKPDLVAPGEYTTSAYAGDPSDTSPRPASISMVSKKSGTSMATPSIAGLAALIRQFFSQGKYPTLGGGIDMSKSHNATSSLVRAVLVNSADPLHGSVGPSPETGFGVPKLSNVIPVFGEFGFRVADDRMIGEHERHSYRFLMNGTHHPLRVTLAYLDPPLSATHNMVLFADLDLFVISPSGRVFIGNGLARNDTEQFNTMERVIIPGDSVESGNYSVFVFSSYFSDSATQWIQYSLVLTGPFNHFDFETNPASPSYAVGGPCPHGCGSGNCEEASGHCECEAGRFGLSCEQEYTTISMQTTYELTLIPGTQTRVWSHIGFFNSMDRPTITARLLDQNYDISFGVCLSTIPIPTYAGMPYICLFPSFSLQYGFTYMQKSFSISGSAEAISHVGAYMNIFPIGHETVNINFKLAVNNYPTATPSRSCTPPPPPTCSVLQSPTSSNGATGTPPLSQTLSAMAKDSPSATRTDSPSFTPTDSPSATPTDTSSRTRTGSPFATSTDVALATATDPPLATSIDAPWTTSTDASLTTSTDASLATSTEAPLTTSTDALLATVIDSPLPTAIDSPLATSTKSPLTTAIDSPLPTAIDSPLATSTKSPSTTIDILLPHPSRQIETVTDSAASRSLIVPGASRTLTGSEMYTDSNRVAADSHTTFSATATSTTHWSQAHALWSDGHMGANFEKADTTLLFLIPGIAVVVLLIITVVIIMFICRRPVSIIPSSGSELSDYDTRLDTFNSDSPSESGVCPPCDSSSGQSGESYEIVMTGDGIKCLSKCVTGGHEIQT
jgi:subtilisin family serine protease